MEFQQVMQTRQEDREDSLSREDIDDYSAKYVEMFFSPDPKRLIKERFGYKQALLASNFDKTEFFSDVYCRHHNKHRYSVDRDKREFEFKGCIDAAWRDKDKGRWKGTAEAKARDRKGNYVAGEITQRSDGTRGGSIEAGRKIK